MSRFTKRDSPHIFNWVLYRLKKRDIPKCRSIFPIESWKNLGQLKSNIYSELVDPLFLKKAINIKDEDNALEHKEDNLICCLESYSRNLEGALKDNVESINFNKILGDFQACYGEIILRANNKAKTDPLFLRIFELDAGDPHKTISLLEKEKIQLEKIALSLKHKMNNMADPGSSGDLERTLGPLFEEWNKCVEKIGSIDSEIHKLRLNDYEKKKLKVDFIKSRLAWLKEGARGKPGRHPKPFNVLTYHLINNNKCTRWKIDRHRQLRGDDPYIYNKDGKHKGEHKLERDWRLIIYLLLDIHLFSAELPEIQRFIKKHGNKPANRALGALKNILWNSYKNFPPLEGWSFLRKTSETGFRKLIVNNDGRLQIVRL